MPSRHSNGGSEPARRGDINYIGQLEDDMADFIDLARQSSGAAQVVLGGHSSGGGFVVRFAGGAYADKADGFVLMAPFLKYNAPTTRPNSGGWAHPATGRIIGLSILNVFGVTAFNGLPVISFAMPEAVLNGPYGKTVTTQYSYRMNTGFAPRADYQADLANISKPLLVMAGTADAAFIAEKYEAVISAETDKGTYAVFDGISHIGVVTEPGPIARLVDWIKSL